MKTFLALFLFLASVSTPAFEPKVGDTATFSGVDTFNDRSVKIFTSVQTLKSIDVENGTAWMDVVETDEGGNVSAQEVSVDYRFLRASMSLFDSEKYIVEFCGSVGGTYSRSTLDGKEISSCEIGPYIYANVPFSQTRYENRLSDRVRVLTMTRFNFGP